MSLEEFKVFLTILWNFKLHKLFCLCLNLVTLFNLRSYAQILCLFINVLFDTKMYCGGNPFFPASGCMDIIPDIEKSFVAKKIARPCTNLSNLPCLQPISYIPGLLVMIISPCFVVPYT